MLVSLAQSCSVQFDSIIIHTRVTNVIVNVMQMNKKDVQIFIYTKYVMMRILYI